jgi:hypothetical protein
MDRPGIIKLFNEPLLHFLVFGAMLFGTYAWLNRGSVDEPHVVRITAADVNWLRVTWSRQWQRPPNDQELRGLVNDYLKEELLAREAKEIGLDEDDTIVRRRLAQKMEFLVQDTISLAEPGEDVLHRFYDSHRTEYQIPARASFMQVYFKTETAARRGLQVLAKLGPDEIGDPSLLGREYSETDEQTVANIFGKDFAASIFSIEPGSWQGPVASSYGFHLVRISERQAAQVRPFDQVRAQALDEWHRTQQTKVSEKFFAGLLKKYDVVVDQSIKSLIGPVGNLR